MPDNVRRNEYHCNEVLATNDPPRIEFCAGEIAEWIEERPIVNNVVSDRVVDAIVANLLCILPHKESRTSIRRRFEWIDQTFEEQH